MAQQKSIFKLRGTIGGVSFYKTQDGYLAREKGGVDATRIASEPGFARTRENGTEFANAAIAGKLLRDAVRELGKEASDSRVTSRLTQVMTQIKNLDTTNVRGARCVAEGINTLEGKSYLKAFDFNINATMNSVLKKPYQVDPETGEISMKELTPSHDVNIPSGASFVIFKSGIAYVNFQTGESELMISDPVRLATDSNAQSISLKPVGVPVIEGTHFILLAVEFVQEINNMDYSLNNNAFNALSIVEVV